MSILVYSGLRELIKRQFHDRDMATIDSTANSIYSMVNEVMSDYRAKAIQLVSTLPAVGVAGTIYLMSKSEPNEKNRFIAYVFENGKYVQVGSSFFPEDFEHDSELSLTSHVTVENRVIHNALSNKYDLSKIINNVVYNDPHGDHADDTPTSTAIKAELDKMLGYDDATRISTEMLWQVFRPEKTRLVYPYIKVNCSYGNPSKFKRLFNQDILTGLKYKSGLSKVHFGPDYYYTGTFHDTISDRDIRIRLETYAGRDHTFDVYESFYNVENYPDEYTVQAYYTGIGLNFRFLDPVNIGLLDDLLISFKAVSPCTLTVTTQISDTGVDNTYTTIQDNVEYDHTYTDGIPFYGFNN